MKKKILAALLALVMVVSLLPTVALASDPAPASAPSPSYEWYTSVTGGDEYTIRTAADLIGFVNITRGTAGESISKTDFENKTVTLGDSIDLGGIDWTPIGDFKGTFDGNSKTISNFKLGSIVVTLKDTGGSLDRGNDLPVYGLFSYVDYKGTIRNLTVSHVTANISGDRGCFGTVAADFRGKAENVTASNITVITANTTKGYCGGMFGFVGWGSAKDCTVKNLNVTSTMSTTTTYNSGYEIGGFAAYVTLGGTDAELCECDNFVNCDVIGFTANATLSGSTVTKLGGFTALTWKRWNHPGFHNCDISGIDFTVTGPAYVGGFIACPTAMVTAKNCTTQGTIDASGVTASESDKIIAVGGFFGNAGNEWQEWGHTINATRCIGCTANVNITSGGAPAGGFLGATNTEGKGFRLVFDTCTASGSVTNETGVAGGFTGIGGDTYGAQPDGKGNFVDAEHLLGQTYKNCSTSSTVNGQTAGGFAGEIKGNVTFDNSSASGEVTSSSSTTSSAGSFIGTVDDSNTHKDNPKPSNFEPKFESSSGSGKVNGTEGGALVGNKDYLASVNGVMYTSFADALAAAAAITAQNVTVTLLKDITLTDAWTPVNVQRTRGDGLKFVIDGKGHSIKGLTKPLLGRAAAISELEIRDLTITESTIGNVVDGDKDFAGAFVGCAEAVESLNLDDCHLLNSTVGGANWNGGLIGCAAGCSNETTGIVFATVTIQDCSVKGSRIEGPGAAGAILGHATGDPRTAVHILDCEVSGNTIICNKTGQTNKAGVLMGTVGCAGTEYDGKTGGVRVDVVETNNTVTSDGTANTKLYGSQGDSTAALTLTGGDYDNYPIEQDSTWAKVADTCCIAKNGDIYTVRTHGEDCFSAVTEEPTYSEDGTRTFYCVNCGEVVRTEPVDKLNPLPALIASGLLEDDVDFADVSTRDYFYKAVSWAVRSGITTGTSRRYFSPDEACTRAQAVTFLWRAAGEPRANGTNPFSDVYVSDYYYEAVLWAVSEGIVKGTSDTTFSPSAACSRAQIVAMLYRAAGEPVGYVDSDFTDVTSGAYYADAVAWAVSEGITDGTGEKSFSPNATCSRAQIVTFLYRS